MKVSIGPYVYYASVFNIVRNLGGSTKLADSISDTIIGRTIDDILEWIYSKRKRRIKIRIDSYDTWNMDHTLSMIIEPMLVQFKNIKHGYPQVDEIDAPGIPEEEKRWAYVIDEMIFAHNYINNEFVSDFELTEEEGKRAQKGLELFGKYYRSLWD